MRGLGQVKDQDRQGFFPGLIDLLVSDGEFESGEIQNIFIVMEAFELDMRSLIVSGFSTGFNIEHLKIIVYNTLCALRFLHSCNIVHRDIKPANILLNSQCQVKICDFGLARTMPDSLTGKGSGNTKRIRDSIIKQQLTSSNSSD
jgi:serine/threonine protein kinase